MSLEALLAFDEDEVARVLAVASKGEPLPEIDQLAAHADDEAVSAIAGRLAVKGVTHPLLVSLILRNANAKTLNAKARVTEGLYYASFHGHNDLSEAQAFLLSGIGIEAFRGKPVGALVVDACHKQEWDRVKEYLRHEAHASHALMAVYGLARYKGARLPAIHDALAEVLAGKRHPVFAAQVAEQLGHNEPIPKLLPSLREQTERTTKRERLAAVCALHRAAEHTDISDCAAALLRACSDNFRDPVGKEKTSTRAASALAIGLPATASTVAGLHTEKAAKARQLGAWIDGFHLASKGNAQAMREAVKSLGASERKHWLAGASQAYVLDPNIFHEDIAAARKNAERRRAELETL
jgi:hypothetical protein